MNFEQYQELSRRTAIYPNLGKNFLYPALGLGGETGEVLEKIKKAIRDDDGKISEKRREELKKEIGDVLWYLSNLSTELSIKLDDAAYENISKLIDRKERDKLHGEGDVR